jgi:hypothetical protein
MASGFVKGALAGVVASGLGLSVVSELAPPPAPQMHAAPRPSLGATTESKTAAKAPSAPTQTPKPQTAPALATTSEMASSQAEPPALSAAPAAPKPAPEPTPVAPQTAAGKAVPAKIAPLPGLTPADQAPAAAIASSIMPKAAPETSLGAAPGSGPGAPVAPKAEAPVTESPATQAPQPPSGAGTAPKFVQAPPKVRLDSTAPAATALLREEPAPKSPASGGPAPLAPKQTPQPSANPAPAEAAPTAPAAAPAPRPRILRPGSTETAPGTGAQPQAALPQITLPQTARPQTAPLPKIAEGMPSIAGAPQPGFGQKLHGVISGRLPKIASVPGAAPPETTPDTGVPDDASLPAYRRYAAAFENPQQKPLLSIVLIDTGGALDRSALAALPLNVSFAIDPDAADASAAAQLYRAAGHEVLILARGIPADATKTDLEQIFARYQQVLPQAVGVLDPAEGGFEANRALSQRIVALLAERGLALLTYARGLDAANQIAQASELPAARIYRRLDADDENPFTITRYLDRAAFKAAQDGRVTVLGHTKPDTIEGLKDWAGDSRARTITLAPVTATLTP